MSFGVDTYTAPPGRGLMPAHPVTGPTRNWQLATLDALADTWRRAGYVVTWAAACALVAHDDRGKVRALAVAREEDE